MDRLVIRLECEVIERPGELLRHYVKHHAYAAYDRDGIPAPGEDPDTLTDRQRQAVNGWRGMRMAPFEPAAFWERWGGCPLPEIQSIPRDLDLIDGRDDDEVEAGIEAIHTLFSRMAEPGDGDVYPTKALHLLRPRFVAISDRRVRSLLCIHETSATAKRAADVQRAVRRVGQANKPVLTQLQADASSWDEVETPLSKARILDMVLWVHASRSATSRGAAATEPPEEIPQEVAMTDGLNASEHGRVGQWHLEQAILTILRRAGTWQSARQISDAAGLYWSQRETFRLVHTVLNKLCHESRVTYQRNDRYRISD